MGGPLENGRSLLFALSGTKYVILSMTNDHTIRKKASSVHLDVVFFLYGNQHCYSILSKVFICITFQYKKASLW